MTFDIDNNSILEVSAVDISTGNKKVVTVTSDKGKTEGGQIYFTKILDFSFAQ